jgi:hypothetical protein
MKIMKSARLKPTVIALALSLMFTCGCESDNADNTAAEGTTTTVAAVPPTTIGEGETNFLLDVTYDDTTLHFTAWTDKTTVGEALAEMQFISGEETDYGLNIIVVNGISADYEKDKAYWAFYVNGEYAMTGVMDTEIVAGDTYAFVKTPA